MEAFSNEADCEGNFLYQHTASHITLSPLWRARNIWATVYVFVWAARSCIRIHIDGMPNVPQSTVGERKGRENGRTRCVDRGKVTLPEICQISGSPHPLTSSNWLCQPLPPWSCCSISLPLEGSAGVNKSMWSFYIHYSHSLLIRTSRKIQSHCRF